jgi:putative Ca2+/H+ antiporter (TMEM165/GDT1 family)
MHGLRVCTGLVAMGDRTQIATVMPGVRCAETTPVVPGTTLGMVLANAPVVRAGNMSAGRLPLQAVTRTPPACALRHSW